MADIALRSLLLCTLLEMVALMAVAVARQPLNPLSWVTAPLHALLAPSSWLYDVLVAAATIGSAALFVRNFSLAPARGWGALSSSLRGPAAASLAGHALASAVLVRCYLGLTGGAYSSLTAQCPLGGRSVMDGRYMQSFIHYSGHLVPYINNNKVIKYLLNPMVMS